MKKESKAESLSNVFNELEKTDLTGQELDRQLIAFGFSPSDLESKVKDRLSKIKATLNPSHGEVAEFDPLLLAAKKSDKDKKGLIKKIRKKN